MRRIWGMSLVWGCLVVLAWGAALGQDMGEGQPGFEFYPGAEYDPEVPTLQQVVGHSWGERITLHHEIEDYVQALAQASPRVQLRRHGESWEGKALYHLIVASEENQGRLEEIRQAMSRLADPRATPQQDADALIASMPSVVWLAYGVHGNEISSPDAALLTAYHLAAVRNDEVARNILDNTVVIIDPTQNPDGRDRFINFYRQTRGRWPDGDPSSAEHDEPWPGGRFNHYLFDMNRDWFAQTQMETHGRLQAYLQWYPQVFVDLHEMGTNSTYYFAPPADPLNPEIPPSQQEMLQAAGRNNAKWFDRYRIDYFTREVFDSFYPGYGEAWPMFKGSVGMTYEQASVRGLLAERSDDTTIHYRESVRNHFVASISTAEFGAENREGLLRYYYDYRGSAIEEGRTGPVREYILPPGHDPNRVDRLAGKLMSQGIEVKRARSAFSHASAQGYYAGQEQGSMNFPAGTYVIPLDQPDKRLISVLMEKHFSMGDDFISEQERRQRKRLGLEIYDVTGWSMPILYNVDIYKVSESSSGDFETLSEAPASAGEVRGGEARLAYLIPWDSNSAARALAWLFRRDIRVHGADESFTMELQGDDVTFPPGSLIVKTKDNPEDLHQVMQQAARTFGITVWSTDASWVKSGINLGSNNVNYLERPKVAMAYRDGVSPTSVGAARYLLEQEYGYPVTVIVTGDLPRAELDRYNVIILPEGFGYGRDLGESGAGRLRDWIRAGGTLVALGSASRWLTGEKIGLLSSELENRQKEEPKKENNQESQDESAQAEKEDPIEAMGGQSDLPSSEDMSELEKMIQPQEERPFPLLGALLRLRVDGEYWVGFGYPSGGANALVRGADIYTPLKLDQGANVAVYEERPNLWLSGWGFEDTYDQIANKPFLMVQRHGRGHVIAFAEDPNYRAFMDGLNLLFMNAVLLGPGH
ncbi:MAG TPA: M14 metallopeptidase family protein [Acidobacteriota bacterium]|nr:M14 metallopeptidase family protein [Acidobacteriota bacterium]